MKGWFCLALAGCVPAPVGGTGTAAVPDAAQVTAASADSAAAPFAAVLPDCASATAAVGCYHQCQPAADQVGIVPTTAPCPASMASALVWSTTTGKPPTAATLPVEIGRGDPVVGTFVPYVNGQWLPIVEGIQGGIHLWAAVRLPLTGAAPKVALDIGGQVRGDGCAIIGTQLASATKAIAQADPNHKGQWTTAKALVPGIPVAFAKNTAATYCGQWVTLYVEVREPKSQAWGHAAVQVRLFELDNL